MAAKTTTMRRRRKRLLFFEVPPQEERGRSKAESHVDIPGSGKGLFTPHMHPVPITRLL